MRYLVDGGSSGEKAIGAVNLLWVFPVHVTTATSEVIDEPVTPVGTVPHVGDGFDQFVSAEGIRHLTVAMERFLEFGENFGFWRYF